MSHVDSNTSVGVGGPTVGAPPMMAYPVLLPFVQYPPSAQTNHQQIGQPSTAAAQVTPTNGGSVIAEERILPSLRMHDKYLNLSDEFLKTVGNRPVREWRTSDALAWLVDLFEGAEDLEKYLSYFRKNAVRGSDLLRLNDDHFEEMGITSCQFHLTRIRDAHSQLVSYQNRLDEMQEAQTAKEAFERQYLLVEKQYLEKVSDGKPYVLSAKLSQWKLVDVFAFFKKPSNAELEKVFLKPIILSGIDGEKLLNLAKPDTKIESAETEKDALNLVDATTVKLIGLCADRTDVERLKRTIANYQIDQEKKAKAAKEEAHSELWRSLGHYDKKKLIEQEKIGEGSFGCVYRANYDKKRVVVKILQGTKETEENHGGMKTTGPQNNEESKRMLRDDLEYEATMLLKAETNGVLKLIALDIDNEVPRMITEYMCNKTLEYEYKLAEAGDKESIFHPNNEHNLIERANNVTNPVLLQMVRIARDVAAAISRIHDKGIIHLDIAARNILLDFKKRPKLADFGCAAMENDMVEIHDLHKATDDDIDIRAMKKIDETFDRKYRMYTHRRPWRWMPHWVAVARPLIDRKVDVYSFGCVMFEMAAKTVPHCTVNDADVAQFKKVKAFNPSIPSNLDGRYAKIMSNCWEDYDKSPAMSSIAKELVDLHSSIATASLSKDIQENSGYWEFQYVKPKEDTIHNKANYQSLYASFKPPDNIPPVSHEPNITAESGVDNTVPLISERINLSFDKVDLSDAPPQIAEYENIGYEKSKLSSALYCAYRLRDHRSIALYMLCIRIEDNIEQIEMINQCFVYLGQLAEDQHGSTNEDEALDWLCWATFAVVNEVLNLSMNVAKSVRILLISNALSSLGSLLSNRTLSEVDIGGGNSVEGILNLENNICNLVSFALDNHKQEKTIVDTVAQTINSFTGLSQLMINKLHQKGIVAGLLGALQVHEDNVDVSWKLVRALSWFPIQQLLNPYAVINDIKAPASKPSVGKSSPTKSSIVGGNKSPTTKPSKQSVRIQEVLHDSVFDKLFGIVISCSQKLSVEEGPEVDEDYMVLVLKLLETCLNCLFRMCESGVNDIDTINRLLHTVTLDSITTLVNVIRGHSDNFTIQEGAIGLLAHIVNTGFVLTIEDNVKSPVHLTPIASGEARISKLLELDPKLHLLLIAMEKFKVNNHIATGIKSSSSEDVKENNNFGANPYHTRSSSRTSRTSVTLSRMRFTTTTSIVDENVNLQNATFELDENGEPITAAALQRSVAIILGIACKRFGKQMQDNLLQTKFNENILSAFNIFSTDVALIQFGCHALYWTSRRHTKHQHMLGKLFIFRHLMSVLQKHRTMWRVVEAVVSALLGLMDPADDVSVLSKSVIDNIYWHMKISPEKGFSTMEEQQTFNQECSKELKQQKETFIGYSIAQQLTAPAIISLHNDKLMIFNFLHLFALLVAYLQTQEDCQDLTSQFLRLICCIGFWLPEYAKKWVDDDIIFVNLSVLGPELLKMFLEKKIIQAITEVMKPDNPSGAKSKSLGEKADPFNKEEFNKDLNAIDKFSKALSLSEYLFRALEVSRNVIEYPNVLASGLAVITSMFRFTLSDADLVIGNEIRDYRNRKSDVTKFRDQIRSRGIVNFCLEACVRQIDHPILIRHSLWIFTMLISEATDVLNDKRRQDQIDSKAIASDLSIHYVPEWAITVAEKYPRHYSLQILSFHLLCWMEIHGFLKTTFISSLESLRKSAQRNLDAPIGSYKALDEEGYDAYLLGQSNKFFGDLHDVSRKMLRHIDHFFPRSVGLDDSFKSSHINEKSAQEIKSEDPTTLEFNEDEARDKLMIDTMGVSPQFASQVPKDVEKWSHAHTFIWFRDIFREDDEEQQEYREKFRKGSIKGSDLLLMTEGDLISQIGIQLANLKSRFSEKFKLLKVYQKKQLADGVYFDLERQYATAIRGKSSYDFPLSMSEWKPVDVLALLKVPDHAVQLDKFLRPLALTGIDGTTLLKIAKESTKILSTNADGTAHPVEEVNDEIVTLKGLDDVSDSDIEILKATIQKFKNHLDKQAQQRKHALLNELWKKLGTFDRKRLTILELLGQGSFGSVYRAQYEKKKVVVKQLVSYEQGDVLKIKERLANDLKDEAVMLLRAETVGVVKLIAIDAENDPPRMVTEYLPNKTLEHEYQLALNNDLNSIFHPENPDNIYEMEHNGVENPVLFQMVRIARDVAGALSRIHQKGVIHLDIAARNILLDLKKRPKLADFGCAAMESDMIEIRELLKRKTAKEMNIEERCKQDEEFAKKYKIYSRGRPVKWMPHWAVDTSWNPLIDRKADVYAFGCVLYEMAMKQIPHHGEADEDIRKRKETHSGNPEVSSSIDNRYSTIMKTCWERYEDQPPMNIIADQLVDLHKQLATEPIAKDLLYSELSIILKAKPRESRKTEQANAPDVNLKDNFIRFHFDHVDCQTSSSRWLELQQAGVPKHKLVSAINIADCHRDHRTIILILRAIVVVDSKGCMEALCGCLESLESLAEDQHGSTNEEGTYQWLCYEIIDFVREISLLGSLLSDGRAAELIGRSLSTLSSLLMNKTLSETTQTTTESKDTFTLENELATIVFDAIRKYGKFSIVAEKVAAAIFSFSGLSQAMLSKLHTGGALGGLLELLKEHDGDAVVEVEIVRALSCFPLHYLLTPVFLHAEKYKSNPSDTEKPQSTGGKPTRNTSGSTFHGRKAAAMTSKNKHGAKSSNPSKTSNTGSELTDQWCQVTLAMFTCIFRCLEILSVERDEDDEEVDDDEDQLTMLLLETSLQSIFRICESAINDTELVNRMLHCIDKKCIISIVQCMKMYPDQFRIQESSVGLLAHILNTGMPIYLRDRSGRIISTLPPPVDSEERLATLVKEDTHLKLITTAMEKFKLSDQISIGIRDQDPNYMSEITITQTVFQSQTQSKVLASRTTRTKATVTSLMDFSHLGINTNLSSEEDGIDSAVVDDVEDVVFAIDEVGEQITAAALQRCSAIVLGIACNSRKLGKTMQTRLQRSRYVETILQSFRNFRRDVSLVRFGCHAIFFTSRRHRENQKILQDLSIFKHLYQALQRHKTIWEVVEAVICAIIGLLEPPGDVSTITNAMIDKVYSTLGLNGESTLSMEHQIKVKEMLKEESTKKKSSYMGYKLSRELTDVHSHGAFTLVQTLALLVAEFQVNDECHLLVQSFLKLLSCIGFWLPEQMTMWNKNSFVNIGSLFSNSRFKQQFQLMICSPGNQGNMQVLAASAKLNEFASKWNYDGDYNLMQFVQLCLRWHQHDSKVLSAAFAVIVAIVREAIPDDFVLGQAIAQYKTRDSMISKYRKLAMSTDLLKLCTEAAARQEDDPILIRYSLWLLILFLSETRAASQATSASDAQAIASEIGLLDCLPWAFAVIKRYRQYYSLQILSSIFLIWMEHHGRFGNCDQELLTEVKSIATENLQATKFHPLEDEGHDTYLLGQTYSFFGSLTEVSKTLIQRIDKSLSNNVADEIDTSIWETSVEQTKPGSHVTRPSKALVCAFKKIVNTEGKKETYYSYTIDVQWSGVKRWNVEHRFSEWNDFKIAIEFELKHVAISFPSVELKKSSLGDMILKTIKPDSFCTERQKLFQTFLTELMKHQSVTNNPLFINFLKTTEHTNDTHCLRRLPCLDLHQQPQFPSTFQVTHLHYNVKTRFLFVVTQDDKKSCLYIYRVESNTGEQRTTWTHKAVSIRCTGKQAFLTTITQIAFDADRLLLMVAITSGAIVFFTLSISGDQLTYWSELNCHHSPIAGMFVDSTIADDSIMVSASSAGTIAVFNIHRGIITHQMCCEFGIKIHSMIFNQYDRLIFCGTNRGSILICCMSQSSSSSSDTQNIKVLHSITIPTDYQGEVNYEDTRIVEHIVIDSKRRLLYVAMDNIIHIWRIFGKYSDRFPLQIERRLNLSPGHNIKNIMLLNDGQYLFVSDAMSRYAVFDLTDEADLDTSRRSVIVNGPRSKQADWEIAVRLGTGAMIAWLHKNGVDTSVSVGTRDDVLRMVAAENNVNEDQIIETLIPQNPKYSVLVAWSQHHTSPTNGQNATEKIILNSSLCSCYLSNALYVAVGDNRGKIQLYSLEDFIIPAKPMSFDKTYRLATECQSISKELRVRSECRYEALHNNLMVDNF